MQTLIMDPLDPDFDRRCRDSFARQPPMATLGIDARRRRLGPGLRFEAEVTCCVCSCSFVCSSWRSCRRSRSIDVVVEAFRKQDDLEASGAKLTRRVLRDYARPSNVPSTSLISSR
jgi:hypothetical protein